MKLKSKLASIVSGVALSILASGCASNSYDLRLHSIPDNAKLYESGEFQGTCPITLNYVLTKESRDRGYILVRPITARWNSGAETKLGEGVLKLPIYESRVSEYTFIRPKSFPGEKEDIEFVKKEHEEDLRRVREREAMDLLRRQTEAAEKQAQAAEDAVLWNNFNNARDYLNSSGAWNTKGKK